MYSSARVRRAIAAILCLASASTAAACGGGGGDLDDASEHRDTTARTTALDDGTTTPGVDSITTTTLPTVTPEGLDLARTPPLVSLTGLLSTGENRIVRFGHASSDPEILLESTPGSELTLSPDTRHAALTTPGDAVRGARLEIVEAASGDVEASFVVDADEIRVYQWAPDNSALLLWQRKSNGSATFGAYRVDDTEVEIESESAVVSVSRVVWDDVDGAIQPLSWTTSSSVPFTLTTTDGELVLVTTGYNIEHGTYDMDTGRIAPFDDEYASERACGRFALLARSTTSGRDVALFDADTGDIVPVGRGEFGRGCPIESNDGSLAAVEFDGGVSVVDLASGTVTQIARQGSPLAWGAGDSKVLVTGNGVFVVDSDGSGGNEASVEFGIHACVVGTTGTLVTVAPNGDDLVRYDIATDSAEVLGIGTTISRDDICEVSDDGDWLLVNNTLVDLVGGTASIWSPSAEQLVDIQRIGPIHIGDASWMGAAVASRS
jgi:hypothetical protein